MANFIQGAIKHPGRLKRAAKRAGVSTAVEARRWAHSKDKSKRGAGLLAERFEHGDIHKANMRKHHAARKVLGGR
jgi:hypothetical protein